MSLRPIWIEGGRVVDPARGIDGESDLLIEGGRIAAWDASRPDDAVVLDARGKIVAPGLVDLATELREPGWEEDETIITGLAAAVAGGYTSVATLPTTEPPVDSQAGVQFVQHKAQHAGLAKVHVIAAISKGRQGEELAEMGALAETGAVAFSDADRPVQNAALFRRALQYAQMFDRPVIQHPEVVDLSRGGVMHDGIVSTILGLPSIPTEAEDVMVSRDLRLAEATGGRLHLASISTAGSVELIRRFKSRGNEATCSVAVANLGATDEAIRSFDSRFKVRPPLRSAEHIAACIEGLRDGTIDVITCGHSPRAAEKKMRELDQAPFGMSGLETALAACVTTLVKPGHLSWLDLIDKLSRRPATVLGIQAGSLEPGSPGDVVVIDPETEWKVRPASFQSKCRSTPWEGATLQARVVWTIVSGKVVYERHGTSD